MITKWRKTGSDFKVYLSSTIQSFIHFTDLCNKFVLGAPNMTAAIPGTENKKLKKADRVPVFIELVA